MPATIRQPVSSICRITTLLRRPLKREDVKRKLIAHKNCIHEIGQDMPEILNRKRHLPEKVYTFTIKRDKINISLFPNFYNGIVGLFLFVFDSFYQGFFSLQ